MRPSISDVFGQGSVWSPSPFPGTPGMLTIPDTVLFPEGGWQESEPPDAQRLLWLIIINASQQLNEANRNNNATGIRTTITYGEYDAIIDPPGSTNVFRRDVWSLLAYKDMAYTPFDPSQV